MLEIWLMNFRAIKSSALYYCKTLQTDLKVSGSMRVWLSPWYELRALGRCSTQDLSSHAVVVATVYEPRSETENFGIKMGVTRVFESHWGLNYIEWLRVARAAC
jgi:hypothetical protein